MTVKELLRKLRAMPPDADVLIHGENDECEVCSHLKHEKCSLHGAYDFDVMQVDLLSNGTVRLEGW